MRSMNHPNLIKIVEVIEHTTKARERSPISRLGGAG